MCEPTSFGPRYILNVADYFNKGFPIRDKGADAVADGLVREIICRFGILFIVTRKGKLRTAL